MAGVRWPTPWIDFGNSDEIDGLLSLPLMSYSLSAMTLAYVEKVPMSACQCSCGFEMKLHFNKELFGGML